MLILPFMINIFYLDTLDSIPVTIDGNRSSLYEVAVVKSGDNEFLITPMTGEKKVNLL